LDWQRYFISPALFCRHLAFRDRRFQDRRFQDRRFQDRRFQDRRFRDRRYQDKRFWEKGSGKNDMIYKTNIAKMEEKY
jgi:hypothetical protein